MTITDPRAAQLAESRYRNGFGPTVAESWEEISDSLREFLISEAASWLGAAVAAGIALPTTEDLAAADNPTQLRWGLHDLLWGDDDHVIVLMSGPEGEPYWLELEPERAAVLRQDVAGPPAEDTGEPAPVVPSRTLTQREYTAAWHAVEGAAGEGAPTRQRS
ncbi:hypothetical protein ACWD25_28485 [Streptomyces sp. NPDC002920]